MLINWYSPASNWAEWRDALVESHNYDDAPFIYNGDQHIAGVPAFQLFDNPVSHVTVSIYRD